jgi:hypothetical protein
MSHGLATRLPQIKASKMDGFRFMATVSLYRPTHSWSMALGNSPSWSRFDHRRSSSQMKKNKSASRATICVGVLIGLIAATQVLAADAPARKPGLWEVKTAIGDRGRAVTVQQCIDAATDQMLQSSAGPLSLPACTNRDVKTSDRGMSIDSKCSFNGKPASAHADITGSFDSAYAMTVTAEGSDLPATKMTMEGKWLGACAAGQQPGDVVMANGLKVNIPELRKRALTPDAATQLGR